jgi:hypothetical protein
MLVKSQRHGQSLSEYGFVMALVVIVAIAGVRMLGQNLNWKFGSMLPGPSTVAAHNEQQSGSQNGGSGSGSGAGAQGSGGQRNGSSKYSGPDGSDLNNATVEVAGGLGNQEQQQENGQQRNHSGQNKGGSEQNTSPLDGSENKGSDTKKAEQPITHEQQLQQYSNQLMQLAKKFKNQYPELYEDLVSLAQASQMAGPTLTDYENTAVLNSNIGMAMAGSRRAISQSWRTVGMSSDYQNISPQDQAAIAKLANASLAVVDAGMKR